MIIIAWVLLIMFGLFALHGWLKFFVAGGLNIIHSILWFISIIIAALSAGIIWGGLLH